VAPRAPPRPLRWIASPADADADADAEPSASGIRAFWLDPLPRTADDYAFRAALLALAPAAAAAAAASASAASSATPTAPPQQQQQQPQQQRVVYILRGLPGSGKSTRARALCARALAGSGGSSGDAASGSGGSSSGNSGGVPLAPAPAPTPAPAPSPTLCPSPTPAAVVHSTDAYFHCPLSGGAYVFRPERLPQYHDLNFAAFEASAAAGVPLIVVDNTNLAAWNYERYVAAAWRRGYRCREERVGEFTLCAARIYAGRNAHGVPAERVEAMLEGFLREEAAIGGAQGGRAGGGRVAAAPLERAGW